MYGLTPFPLGKFIWPYIKGIFAVIVMFCGVIGCVQQNDTMTSYGILAKQQNDTMTSYGILAKCREKWGWKDQEEFDGRPTVEIHEFKNDSVSRYFPESKVYRVFVLNLEVWAMGGPPKLICACITRKRQVKFLENDADAQDALSQAVPTNTVELIQLINLFADLRGYRMQIGVPYNYHEWLLVPHDLPNPEVIPFRIRDPRSWSLLVQRQTNTWEVECSFIALYDSKAYRYHITAGTNGAPVFRRKVLIHQPIHYK